MNMAILIGHEVVPANHMTWARWFEAASRTPGENGEPTARHVAHDDLPNGRVSTVFLGLDHSHGLGGPPLWFETMVFIGSESVDTDRYTTWDEAAAGHAAMLAKHTVKGWA
jgi:hypothetical protein